MSSHSVAPETCANCGADIPRSARACPECGADERTGWREASPYDGIDLPEPDADQPPGRDVNGLKWYWWTVGIALLLLLALTVVGLR
jgi:hypothetical protein